MLLYKCGGLSTDTMGLLNHIICSENYNEFRGFMKIVYVNHKKR